jgi:hypothetical protein
MDISQSRTNSASDFWSTGLSDCDDVAAGRLSNSSCQGMKDGVSPSRDSKRARSSPRLRHSGTSLILDSRVRALGSRTFWSLDLAKFCL